jgi:hypothetical protein
MFMPQTQDKIDDVKDSFYKEVDCVIDKFHKHHTEMLLGDFNAKTGRDDICKPTLENGSLHETINGNGVTVVNFASPRI